MKTARTTLKIIAGLLAIAAAICCVAAYADKLGQCFGSIKDRMKKERGCCYKSEYDDYADWDE